MAVGPDKGTTIGWKELVSGTSLVGYTGKSPYVGIELSGGRVVFSAFHSLLTEGLM